MQAIRASGNELVAAVDPNDSVGVLDRYFPQARFFTEIERFDRHLEKLRRAGNGVDWVSICSPNYLHDSHVRLAMRVRAHAICEKPLVINSWNLDQLSQLGDEFQRRVCVILQLRRHPALLALRDRLGQETARREVVLQYVTHRGPWYRVSWKGSAEKSGGLAVNLGIHLFDLLLWLFGPVERSVLRSRTTERMAGTLELQRARVRWLLSVSGEDLPARALDQGRTSWRSLIVDGEEIELSTRSDELHTLAYQEILAGGGPGISEARPSIELVQRIRASEIQVKGGVSRPLEED